MNNNYETIKDVLLNKSSKKIVYDNITAAFIFTLACSDIMCEPYILKEVLERANPSVFKKNLYGISLIHILVKNHHYDVFRNIIDFIDIEDLNYQDRFGFTALSFSCGSGYYKCFDLIYLVHKNIFITKLQVKVRIAPDVEKRLISRGAYNYGRIIKAIDTLEPSVASTLLNNCVVVYNANDFKNKFFVFKNAVYLNTGINSTRMVFSSHLIFSLYGLKSEKTYLNMF